MDKVATDLEKFLKKFSNALRTRIIKSQIHKLQTDLKSMDGTNINGIDYTNHALKCRICFKIFSIDEHKIEISKVIAKKFRDVTQTEVVLVLFIFRASYNINYIKPINYSSRFPKTIPGTSASFATSN